MESESIQLIEQTQEGDFKVNPEALDWLSNLNKLETIDTPLAVISVVGKYRTGKSYLINKMLI